MNANREMGVKELFPTKNPASYLKSTVILFLLLFQATIAMAAPVAPTLNSATAGSAQVTLSWSAVSTATSYNVKYGTKSKNYTITVNAGSATTYTVSNLNNGTTYYFVVTAVNSTGTSANSNEKSAKPQAAPALTAPVLNSVKASDQQVSLFWSAVSGATSYNVQYGTKTKTYTKTINAGNVTSYTVSGLTNGKAYFFVVAATNGTATSANSNELSATPAVVIAPTEFIKNTDYNASGQITRIEYGNGVVTTYTYDALNFRLKRIYTINSATQVLQDLNYNYDSIGNILKITDAVNTATQTFKYDELNRLIYASGGYGTKTYSYDKIGNIIQKDGKTYSYGAGAAGSHAVTSLSDGTVFEYDANGNMIKKTEAGNLVTAYGYDSENKLTRVDKNGQNVALYYYDGDGGRTKTIINGVVTTFVGSLYEETSTRKTKYIYLGATRVASVSNGNVLYYHGDHLGSANVLTDSNGLKKELVEYSPFGTFSRQEKFGSSDEIARYYFTGQRADDLTGLYFYNARYYDPSLGRFITPDSMVSGPGNPQELNRYSYVLNNPINYTDPTGHWSFKKFWKSFAGAFIGAVATVLTAGAGAPLWAAGLAGGFLGGATTGGLSGGARGALFGGLIGGALGGLGGWGAGIAHAHNAGNLFAAGAFLAGAGAAGATDSWDSFAGGFSGGYLGSSLGNGYLSIKSEYMDEQSPLSGIRAGYSYGDNENVAFLGAWTTQSKAISFANENQMTAVYTKSRGILADLFRAAFKKIGVKGPYVNQSANYLNVSEGKFILAHSEGAQNLAAGIQAISANGAKFKSLDIKWIGAAISRSNAVNLSDSIRASSSYGMNWADPVGAVSTFNPVMMGVYGGLGTLTGGRFHGTDYYAN